MKHHIFNGHIPRIFLRFDGKIKIQAPTFVQAPMEFYEFYLGYWVFELNNELHLGFYTYKVTNKIKYDHK